LAGTGLNLVLPWLVKLVIDEGLVRGERIFLIGAALAILLVTLVKGVFSYGQGYLVGYVSHGLASELRSRLYDHIQRLSFGYHDKAYTGQLMTRVTSDVDSVRMFYGSGLVNIFATTLLSIAILTILLRMHVMLTLVSLSVLPIIFFRAVRFGRIIRPLFLKTQEQLGKLATLVQETLTGVKVVKAFGREEDEIRRFEDESWEFLERNMAATRVWAFHFPLMSFMTTLGTILILWYGGREVLADRLSIGTLVAFNSYLLLLAWPVRSLGWTLNLGARASASAERILEVLDTQPEIRESPNPVILPRLRGEVRFEGVNFAYEGVAETLSDIDLNVRPGETVALVGPTGSGKTTLVHLIPRFYEVRQGRVSVDGHDVREVALASLRRQIAVVLQDTFLFSASIAENIAYGKPEATKEEIERVAELAQLGEFIISVPNGLDTLVGERGITLSGGERQRVTIARALLMDSAILILDDATSNVDAETEFAIRQAMAQLFRGQTTFVIAHRFSTVQHADQILVLEGGKIVERGTHMGLLGLGGRYARVYALQLSGAPTPALEG
ncbi:MAG: ABC transporter ATP-binding protein, partial [Chloroflexi bacterium]|nr:ABC transporter ATP-binding protein [Chloroflexota bacterium]